MLGKLLFALCALTCLKHVSSSLTKEINPQKLEIESPPLVAFEETWEVLNNPDIRQNIAEMIFKSPEVAIYNLAVLLSKNDQPEVSEVLDALNAGFGSKLFVINGDYVQVDQAGFDRVMSENARKLAKTLYPKDYFQQLMAFATFQQQINLAKQIINPVLADKKIPVQEFEALLSSAPHAIARREIQNRDIITDIFASLQYVICQTVVSVLSNTINATLTSANAFLDTITIATGDNIVLSLLSTVLDLVKDLAATLIDTIGTIANTFTDGICGSSNSSTNSTSRRRRDVDAQFDFIRFNIDANSQLERALATRGLLEDIWSTVWGLLSSVLNSVLTALTATGLSSLITLVSNLLNDIVGTFLYNLIDSIFPGSSNSNSTTTT